MVPKVMSNKVDEWKAWSTDLMEHVDSITPGMKEFLEQLAKLDDEPSPSFLQFYSGKIDIELERVKIYRTLKKLTDGEAKKVVTAVKGEDGLEAWQRLVNNFEPTLAGRQGRALNELTDMIKKPAKTTEDTRQMIVELMEKIRIAEELAEEGLSDAHRKSILVGIMDPLTRQHTAMCVKENFEELKKKVLEFVTNASATRRTPMQLGQIGSQEEQDWQYPEWEYPAGQLPES